MKFIFLLLLAGICNLSFSQESQIKYYAPNPGVTQPFVLNYDESKIPSYTLPDPLVMDDGRPVKDAGMWWRERRPEIMSLFENEMYGKTPPLSRARPEFLRHARIEVRSEKKDALGGKATRREVRLHFSTLENGPWLDVLLYLPNQSKKPVPAFIMLNFRGNQSVTEEPDVFLCESWVTQRSDGTTERNRVTEKSRGAARSRWPVEMIIDRGYALATACYHDLDPDYDDGFQNGVQPLFYRDGQKRPAAHEWGSIGAWAWGSSRILDYLETENRIDPGKVVVSGHSRLGKASLWAGAQDQRFAVVISNNSGCGGGSPSKRVFGETTDILSYVRPHWFCENFKYYDKNEQALEFDQHELLALIAPRPVYLATAKENISADPKGELLTALNADAVYRLLGTKGIGEVIGKNVTEKRGNMIYDAEMPPLNHPVGETIGYHIRTGIHDVTKYDWEQYMNFTDKVFRSSK